MFYEVELKGHIRIPPNMFGKDVEEAMLEQLNSMFKDHISKDFGIVIAVSSVVSIGEGIIIPGDGAAYYKTVFKVYTFKPELQEVILGNITQIEDFGAFIGMGPIDGMIHISQTMDDFVSFSKSGVLSGKKSRRNLKIGDDCRARIIAVSYKELKNPKIGLTMRQWMLGSLSSLKEEIKKTKEK